MTNSVENQYLAEEYTLECRDHVAAIERYLLALDEDGAGGADQQLAEDAFQSLRLVKVGAVQLDLSQVHEVAERTEEVLAQIRRRDLTPTPDTISVLLRATDRIDQLIHDPGASRQDSGTILSALDRLTADDSTAPRTCKSPLGALSEGRSLRILLVEDDFASRIVLQSFLSVYGECHVAVNGKEAVAAFQSAAGRGERYDLICMDIMMPEMDGREAVRQIRAMEEGDGILSPRGAKIIMTTAMDDIREVSRCFGELCDAYLVKPIDLNQVLCKMKSYGLI